MTKEEYKQLKKEIIRQLGAEKFDETLRIDVWPKVDPKLEDKYKKNAASCLEKTIKNIR